MFDSPEIKAALGVALAGIGTMLLTGKGIRRLLLLPFEWLSSRTASKVDDVIVRQIESDLDIKPVMEEANAPSSEK